MQNQADALPVLLRRL